MKKTITFNEYNKQINRYNSLIKQGLKPIIKRNTLKIVLGCVCLGLAIFPNGLGFALYPLSFYLLGFSLRDLEEWKRKTKNKIKEVRLRV